MSEPLVLALVAADVPEDAVGAVRAGFEEEGVPLVVESGDGQRTGARPDSRRASAARPRARRRLRGAGARCSPQRRRTAYLQAAPEGLRAFAQDAARVAGRRPLRRPAT